MKVLLLLGLLAYVTCEHVTLEEVANQVIADTDVNNDGVISVEEFKTELLARWAGDATAESVTRQQFIHQWMNTYGDNHNDAGAFFDTLDTFLKAYLTNSIS